MKINIQRKYSKTIYFLRLKVLDRRKTEIHVVKNTNSQNKSVTNFW